VTLVNPSLPEIPIETRISAVDQATPGTAEDKSPARRSRAAGRLSADVRLVDVARAAGVSPMTVSNVLGGRTGFTEETRERVVSVAAELGYSPNRAAQRLRSQRSRQLGLHLPAERLSVREPFSISFLRAATEAAERAGQQLVVFTTPLEEESVRDLVRAGVDGFVLCNVGQEDPRPRVFTDLQVPFALMGRLDPDLPQSCVEIDNAAAMALVVDHLVEKGHRSFAYVGYDSDFHADVERLAGTLDRLAHHGLELNEDRILTASVETAGDVATRHLLKSDVPDAIICSSDSLAIRVHNAMKKVGLQPGTDIALTGFDGLPLAFELEPPLTSVRLPIEEATTSMIDMLIRRIDGNPPRTAPLIIPTQLAQGGTT